MTKRLTQIEVVLNGIEEMKRRIVLVSCNDVIPYAIKTQKLERMRVGLLEAEHYALELMRDEISEIKAAEQGDGDGHDKR